MVNPSKDKRSVGFIGLGNMGQPMALRLVDTGYPLVVHDIRHEAMVPLLQKGAKSAASPKLCVQDAIITVLATPRQVEQVYFGKEGILEGLKAGQTVIEASGIDPETTLLIESEVRRRAARILTCTLDSGGGMPSVTIPQGLLSMMVGGEKTIIEQNIGLLQAMAQTLICSSDIITPKLLKIARMMLGAAQSIAAIEVVLWLKKNGVNPEWLIKSIQATRPGSEAKELEMVLAGGIRLGGNIRNPHKDLSLALQLAIDKDLPLPLITLAQQLYQSAKNGGAEEPAMTSLLALYRHLSGESLPPSHSLDLQSHLPKAHPPLVIWLD